MDFHSVLFYVDALKTLRMRAIYVLIADHQMIFHLLQKNLSTNGQILTIFLSLTDVTNRLFSNKQAPQLYTCVVLVFFLNKCCMRSTSFGRNKFTDTLSLSSALDRTSATVTLFYSISTNKLSRQVFGLNKLPETLFRILG